MGKFVRLKNGYYRELRKKFKEKLNEYLENENDAGAIEGLADVLEVIHCLSEIHGKGFRDVEEVRQRKLNERGGFKGKIYLVDVDDNN